MDTSTLVAALVDDHEHHTLALIARVCAENDVDLVTLDARQHQIALALGARSTYLLA